MSKATALFSGLTKTYQPNDEDGERLPEEEKLVQLTVDELLQKGVEVLSPLIDAVATQEWANCVATADVVVDNQVILDNVPVSYLMFLEKQLNDINTWIGDLPTLPTTRRWRRSESTRGYESEPVETNRTKKVRTNHVLAEATEKHPAQVQVFDADEIVGRYRTVDRSGCMPIERSNILRARVRAMIEAVRQARELANATEVVSMSVADKLFKHLFSE